MGTYRVKLVYDLDALDDADARRRVEKFLAAVQERVLDAEAGGFRAQRAHCVQNGDHSGRNVLKPQDTSPA